jgi:hypothetical protein
MLKTSLGHAITSQIPEVMKLLLTATEQFSSATKLHTED